MLDVTSLLEEIKASPFEEGLSTDKTKENKL